MRGCKWVRLPATPEDPPTTLPKAPKPPQQLTHCPAHRKQVAQGLHNGIPSNLSDDPITTTPRTTNFCMGHMPGAHASSPPQCLYEALATPATPRMSSLIV